MVQELAPILFLLTTALVVFGGMNLAHRLRVTRAVGGGVVLCIIAITIGVSPISWRVAWAGGSAGDSLLTYARVVGISGLLFIAGTRFDFDGIRFRVNFMVKQLLAAGLLVVTVLILAKLLAMDLAPIVLVAASVIASSLWFQGELRSYAKKTDLVINWQVTALVFATTGFLVVYFFDVLSMAHRASLSAYVIVLLYESVKLFVLFGFAYFICSRFLARAAGRVSANRTIIGFVLITILIFGLTVSTTNQLGAFAWAFVAGALWQLSEIGTEFRKAERPAASAMLMSLAFVPLMLQTHGRDLREWPTLALFLISVVVIKTLFTRLSIKAATLPKDPATRLAIALSAPGEIAIGFLGFAITRWPIESATYFVILGYALLATVLIPSMNVVRTRETEKPTHRRLRSTTKGGGEKCIPAKTY